MILEDIFMLLFDPAENRGMGIRVDGQPKAAAQSNGKEHTCDLLQYEVPGASSRLQEQHIHFLFKFRGELVICFGVGIVGRQNRVTSGVCGGAEMLIRL